MSDGKILLRFEKPVLKCTKQNSSETSRHLPWYEFDMKFNGVRSSSSKVGSRGSTFWVTGILFPFCSLLLTN